MEGKKVEEKVVFELTARPVDIGADTPSISLREPSSDEDDLWLLQRGIGIRSVTLDVEGKREQGPSHPGLLSKVCQF